ncbi:hypothetical protein ACFV2Z_40110, partial [Streptomyces sp. NPDC059688]|uniref:hypothetical protein n=1 Tax=Streptomyces sp. NPDC059688 TaxID=3346906 RepID=UPI0036B83A23
MKNRALWRVVDNESGSQSIVSTPSEAVAFVNSRFDTDDDDEPFSITEVGPLLPKPLGVITAWAAEKDGERTDGRTAPITIRPIVTYNASECDDVVLWGDVYVSWDHDMYTVEEPDSSEYSEAYSAAELSAILDEYADGYEYAPEGPDSHRWPKPEELITYGAQECAKRFGHLDDDALLWLAATRITLAVWRNTPVENWHAGKSPLHDGTMMRINTATTRLVRSMLSFNHVDWIGLGLAIVNPSRVLPTGQSVLELGLACHNPDDPAHEVDPRVELAGMAQVAISWGRRYCLPFLPTVPPKLRKSIVHLRLSPTACAAGPVVTVRTAAAAIARAAGTVACLMRWRTVTAELLEAARGPGRVGGPGRAPRPPRSCPPPPHPPGAAPPPPK